MAAKRRKRSVAELFAAVPPVAVGQAKRATNGAQAKEKGKGKGKFVLVAEGKASKGLKKKVGIGVRTKEKSSSIKATSISIPPLFTDSIRKRKLTKSLGKKKRYEEASVLQDKKSKGKETSLLDSKKNKINSVQAKSILHKQSRVGFGTLTDNTDVTCKPKHVTFSHDICGCTAPLPEDNTDQAQSVQTSQQPHRGGDELQYQQADAIPVAIEEDTCSLSEVVVPAGVFCTFPVAKPKERTTMGNSVGRNHCTEIANTSNYLNSISLACLSSKMPSQTFDDVGSHLSNDEDFSLDADCLGEENHMISQGSSSPVSLAVKATPGGVYGNLLSEPSSSCVMLPERMVANRHLGKVHHKFISSCEDMVNSISSSAGSNKSSYARATDCESACRNKYFGDDYTGLPLNSRGEFVKLHPGGTYTPNYMSKRQCLGESSPHPSAFQAFYTPTICSDHVNLRSSHLVPNTIGQSPRFTPTASTEYEMDFRQLPCSERMTRKYATPSNKHPCTKQQELSTVCFCPECMGCYNPPQKTRGMQSCYMRQNGEQNTQSTSETTMRLMGKTVTLGTSSIQCTDLNIENLGSCKEIQAEDRSFPGTCRKAFPQLFHWEMGDPSAAFKIPHGERELYENPSFLPAAERRHSYRTNSYSQQPELASANNLYVQPAIWCNEGELRDQPRVLPNQVQSSVEFEDIFSVSMHLRNTQNIASVPRFNRRNRLRNFMEKRPEQPGYFTQKLINMTQRNPVSSSLSGHAAVQSTPGLTTQTKFTSLPPLPPSLPPSHLHSLDNAQHCGSNTTAAFRPSIPSVYQTSRSSAPGNAISRVERLKWAMMGSNVEDSGQMIGNGKRTAEKDDSFLTSLKKPCTVAQEDDLNLLPLSERGLQFSRSRPDALSIDLPVGFGPEPRLDF